MNHYDTLGIADRKCTAADIKHAFRRAAKKAHPDREGGSTERMAAVNRAYSVLGDAKARADYDATGAEPGAPGKTLRDRGREALMSNFDRILDSGISDGKIMKALRDGFDTALLGLRTGRPALQKKRDVAKKRVARLRAKEGENFLGVVLSGRLSRAEAELALNQENIETVEEALRQLDNYEFAADPEQEAAGSDPRRASHMLWDELAGGITMSKLDEILKDMENNPRQDPPKPHGPAPRSRFG
jgi:curved DNA-binding protein CbpA